MLISSRTSNPTCWWPPGSFRGWREMFELEEGEMVAFVPVTGRAASSGRVQAYELPPVELAIMVHQGSYDELDQTYGALGTYVAERAIVVEGPIREHYVVSPLDVEEPSELRTEVGWPVFRTSSGRTAPCRTVAVVFERYSDQARQAVELGEVEARRLGHGHLGTEHLLLGILAEGRSAAARALTASGATLQGCRELAAEAVGEQQQVGASDDLRLTDRATRAMERAARLARRRRDPYVETGHVLLSVLDVEGRAGQVLRGLNVDLGGLRNALDTTAAESVATGPAQPDAPASDRVQPRCARCRAELEEALTYRVITSATTGPGPKRFMVSYCSVCGTAICAHPE